MTFEDIGKKITQSGQDILQKSQDFTEVNRLESEIKKLEKENDAAYAQIGRYYYQKLKDQQPDAEAAAHFDTVSANLQGIADRQEQIRVLKGIVQCPQCGEDVSKDATFCNNCGTRLIPIVPDTSGYGSCPGCGAAVDEGQKFCTSCGRKLDVIIPTKKAEEEPQTPPPAPKLLCASCGAQLEEGMAFCIYCGTKVGAAPAVSESASAPASEEPAASQASSFAPEEESAAAADAGERAVQEDIQQERPGSDFTWQEYQTPQQDPASDMPVFCTQCGALLESDMKYCTSCGARVE